jgi:hypothetical protein
MQQRLLEFPNRVMRMRVTHHAVDISRHRNISAANVANDDGAVITRELARVCAQPIMVFDRRFNATVFWQLDTHRRQESSRIFQVIEKFFWGAFPEMQPEGFSLMMLERADKSTILAGISPSTTRRKPRPPLGRVAATR